MKETFKTIQDANLSFMKEIFIREDTRYNLKCMVRLNVLTVNSNKCGLELFNLSETVKFGICFLINLRLYQVCSPLTLSRARPF